MTTIISVMLILFVCLPILKQIFDYYSINIACKQLEVLRKAADDAACSISYDADSGSEELSDDERFYSAVSITQSIARACGVSEELLHFSPEFTKAAVWKLRDDEDEDELESYG